jgi:hypothetical protein
MLGKYPHKETHHSLISMGKIREKWVDRPFATFISTLFHGVWEICQIRRAE